MNNEKKLPENVNYPLIYDELINGDFYATEYEDQGIYIFKNGYNLWLREGDSFPVTENNGNFTPENGFNKFRYATTAEVNRLVATTDQKQPRLKVGDKIPEYLDGKLNFGSKPSLSAKSFHVHDNMKIDSILGSFYFVKEFGSQNWYLKISEVDALIEEHEKELEKTVEELFPMDGEEVGSWGEKEITFNIKDWETDLDGYANKIREHMAMAEKYRQYLRRGIQDMKIAFDKYAEHICKEILKD